MRDGLIRMFLCGDVMLGRGVDQILPYPGDPTLQEGYVNDARGYVELAEAVNGSIPVPTDFAWPWGDALAALAEVEPDVRVLNLETSVTQSPDFAPGKAVHYRMNPANLPCLRAIHPDVCVLANNHVLDFGPRGLLDTLDQLADARLPAAGAGRDAAEASRPVAVDLEHGRRVLVCAIGMASSGIPANWAAADDRPGVYFVPEPTEGHAGALADRVLAMKRPRDIVIVSIHWGTNWGYDVPRDHVAFAHSLIDRGVDLVHGHSSHHPRPIEVYAGKLILYGCGDFVDDYEGIGGYPEYRDDLRLLYLLSVEPDSGRLDELRIVPMQARQMRLHQAAAHDREWLRTVLNRISRAHGSEFDLQPDGALALRLEP